MGLLVRSEGDNPMRLKKGFTLPELIVVFGMIAILMGFITLRVVPSQRRTSLSESLAMLAADTRQQQLKSMLGEAPTGTASEFGIFFSAYEYVLFRGSAYNPADPANFTVSLDPGFTFTRIDFPASVIVFSRGSGEINSFTADTYDLVITDDQDGSSMTVTFNRYGAVTAIN